MENILKEVGPFRLTKKDINAFVWDSLIKDNHYLGFISYSVGIGMGLGVLYGISSHSWTNFIAVFIWGTIGAIIFNIVKIIRVSSNKDNKILLTHDITILLCEALIIGAQNGNISRYSWKNFKSIRQSKNHVFLYTKKYSGYIVPKNAFSGEQELLEFLETAFELIETNQSDN